MNLSEELINVLEKAKQTGEYFNPRIVSGVLNSVYNGCPDAESLISNELDKWAANMWGR